jgi:hypothetical protein
MLDRIDDRELRELVHEAYQQVGPKTKKAAAALRRKK